LKNNQTYREDEGTPGGLSNGQSRQPAQDLPPSEGDGGYVGSNTGSALGLTMVEGKKGSVTSKAIWSTSFTEPDNSGSEGNGFSSAGQDSTDEKASYKDVQTDEGLPQTYRDSKGAGDAGVSGSDEPDQSGGVFQGMGGKGPRSYNTQDNEPPHPPETEGSHEMDMPQTDFTHSDGGGAPRWKR
jgi:hypothetical protein